MIIITLGGKWWESPTWPLKNSGWESMGSFRGYGFTEKRRSQIVWKPRRVAPPWIQYLGHDDLGVLHEHHELGTFMICNSGESEKFAEWVIYVVFPHWLVTANSSILGYFGNVLFLRDQHGKSSSQKHVNLVSNVSFRTAAGSRPVLPTHRHLGHT